MKEIEIGTYYLGSEMAVYLQCSQCGGKPALVDVLSIEEKPWSLPVWACQKCKYVYSGRTKFMENTADNYAKASKKYVLNTRDGKVPDIKEVERQEELTERKSDPIRELRKSIKSFKLK